MPGEIRRFDLPAADAPTALKQFSAQSGRGVLVATDVIAGVRTSAVHGEFVPAAALQLLLAGTPLVVVEDPATGTFALRQPPSESKVTEASADRPPLPDPATMKPKNLLARIAAAFALLSAAPAHAQSGTGTISGRVYNPATQEYVRNAEVAISGTNLVAYTGDDGSYALTSVPAGQTSISVTYTGYEPAAAQLSVGAGQTAVRDFDLKPLSFSPALQGAVIQLSQFVVSSEREGNAKAIMEQRAAVNFKNVVASDNFGDVTGGSIGEFIKYLPGVVMDYVDSDARTARIGGLSPVYTGVSVDGMSMASAPSASFGETSRQFEFEQASINGIESIEISKTATASMDADAPAGRINLRSRSAFDRKNREITTQLTFTGNEYSWSLRRTPGPYNDSYYKIRPGFVFSYADAFKGKFGLQLSLAGNTVGTEQAGVTHTYNYAANRAPVISQIAFRDAPKLSNRASFTLNTDYKISPRLSVALRTSGSHFDDGTNLRQIAFFVNPAQVMPDSTVTSFTALPSANANTRVQYTTSRRNKVNTTVTYVPKLEYKRADLSLTLGGGYSRSRTAYEQMTEGYFQAVTHRLTRIGYTAIRSSPTDTDWTLTQTSGLSWNDPANYNRTDAFTNNISATPQASRHQVWVGYLDIKKTINLADLPVQFLVGTKTKLSVYDLEKNGALRSTYVGAAGSMTDPGTRLPISTILPYDARTGGNIVNLDIPLTDPYATFDLFKANPSHFTPDLIANHINENYSSRAVKEQIDAYYLETNTRWRALRINLGVRQEKTTTIGKKIDLRTPAAVRAAGFTPNTIPFVDYQYRYGHRSESEGGYDNTFLSGGAKYAFTRNLHFQLAASQSISRPSYGNVAGVITIDEVNQTIRVPNPDLKPETSDKYFASLQYYLEPAGTLSLTGFRLAVDNMGVGNTPVSAAEAGYDDDPEYSAFTFTRPSNAPGTIELDGVEIEYSQQLVFLPKALRGFSVFGSLSRTAASERIRNHVPKSANGGIRYGNHKFNAQLRCTWQAARFNSASVTEELWQYERLMFDFSGGYRFNRTYELTVSGRNILNEPIRTYSNGPGLLRVINHYGASWTVGVRGRW
ncbi:MAG: TonB-dependent receptor domain-containing protein [Opitutaceae bacterium]